MAMDYQSILSTYRDLQNQANQANEQRYQNILGTIHNAQSNTVSGYKNIADLLDTLGQSRTKALQQKGQQSQATADQGLISRGLGNTTIQNSVNRGIHSDTNDAITNLLEQVAGQKANLKQSAIGANTDLAKFLANAMYQRSDNGPDLGSLLSLIQSSAAAQGENSAAKQTLNTGLSANARAGLDAFGQPFRFSSSTPQPQGGMPYLPSPASGGGSGGGVTTFRNPNASYVF